MFKPVQVKALANYKLWVKYARTSADDGVEGIIDLSHLVGKGVFSLWEDYAAFQKVYIGSSGEIAWSDKADCSNPIDICPDAVYLQITGKMPEQVFPNLTMAEVFYA